MNAGRHCHLWLSAAASIWLAMSCTQPNEFTQPTTTAGAGAGVAGGGGTASSNPPGGSNGSSSGGGGGQGNAGGGSGNGGGGQTGTGGGAGGATGDDAAMSDPGGGGGGTAGGPGPGGGMPPGGSAQCVMGCTGTQVCLNGKCVDCMPGQPATCDGATMLKSCQPDGAFKSDPCNRGCAGGACCMGSTEAVAAACVACGAQGAPCCKIAMPPCDGIMVCEKDVCVLPCGDGPGQKCCEGQMGGDCMNRCGKHGKQMCKGGVYTGCSVTDPKCCDGDKQSCKNKCGDTGNQTCSNGSYGSCSASNPECCKDSDCNACQRCVGGKCNGPEFKNSPQGSPGGSGRPGGEWDWNCNGKVEVTHCPDGCELSGTASCRKVDFIPTEDACGTMSDCAECKFDATLGDCVTTPKSTKITCK
jgi:hypothetical protein